MKTVFTVSFFVCMMLIASIAWSDIIHVPSDYDTIQEAIDAAVDGDIISVEYAVHTEAGITVNKDLTVQGYGISNTIVQAAETVDQATDRVFKISSGNVTIKDMTIRHGKIDNYYGGGIGLRLSTSPARSRSDGFDAKTEIGLSMDFVG